MDDCDFDCAQTHDSDVHEALRETRKERLHVLITTQITKAYQDGIDDAIEAAKTEYLQDATCDSEDVAYDQAISDAILAIRALKTTI